jgi:carbamoyl-phosphate synthase large subunit
MGSAVNQDRPIESVLVLGSGPIVIGQAAEFDYAGTQACRALREEGIRTILVNSNPATIMTDEDIADSVYIEPLTPEVVRRVIQRERPDGLLPTLGGQTGLNLAVEVAEQGILDRYGVRLLGTQLPSIKMAEDRALFKQLLEDIGEPAVESAIVHSVDEAREFAREVPLPLVIRPAFTLGGTGGGVASTPEELDRIVSSGLNASPIRQVLLERSLTGWKEIEYEVMRDGADTCITICNMENLDPMGVHTGDSIVVAPSQTLSDYEYQMLRSSALKIIRALRIEGGCNIQYALDPNSFEYSVIEVNPRVSRSSALASKATGYPIARMAAKIAIGRRLDELRNAVTGKTTAAFEPALDYVVVKIPRWPFDKFGRADRTIGTQMKATGEVMAIDRSFEGALQKAVRSLETTAKDLNWEDPRWADDTISELIRRPNDLRLWAVMAALRRSVSPEQIHGASGIDMWFLDKMQGIVEMEASLRHGLTPDLLWQAKQAGFSDRQISLLSGTTEIAVRRERESLGVFPVFKMVDTCAGEFAASTPYFYSTYEDEDEAAPIESARALVVGSGPIRIGQGIEFDYCSVHASRALHDAGVASIMVNSNPETVSTDFDASDRLYFEPLDAESVWEIIRHESNGHAKYPTPPVIVQFGGQTAINLAEPLQERSAWIMGSSTDSIDLAEDRERFEAFLRGLGIPQPHGAAVTSLGDAEEVADRIGYPVLVRPSYVLGGRAMEVVYSPEQLARYIRNATTMTPEHPVLVDKYLLGKEVEVDAICDGESVLIPGIMEHIERAGVHSGDSFAVYPGINLFPAEIETIVDYTTRIAFGIGAKGLINIQYVIHAGRLYVLEVNPRSSRTVPFLSKVTGVPMVKLATNIMLGRSLTEQGYPGGLWPRQPLIAVKAPVFSMAKLRGVEVNLGPEMKSTGEVMGIDRSFDSAFYKALIAAGLALPTHGSVLVSLADEDKSDALEMIGQMVRQGLKLYATEGTAAMIERAGMPVQMVTKRIGRGKPDILDVILQGIVDGVINTPGPADKEILDGLEIRRAAVERGIPCITSIDTARAMVSAMATASDAYSVQPLPMYRSSGFGY